jgi:TonB-linked SusC/RagA family outer membrane protein
MGTLKQILTGVLLLASGALSAQVAVSGRVTDAKSGEPVVGATVVVKGTSIGASTDANGSYSIQAEANATLVISFMGYGSKQEALRGRTSVDVQLTAEAQDLDEVVVVGASMRKSDLTGAVASVSSKTLEERPVTTINEAIQGRVAGVFISQASKPGDDASIRIRGTNTITNTTDPIYVVDGLVMDNFGSGFGSVNVNDVSSVEVLKDASATALYGSRASNGVVLITTKKGKAGEGKVSYDAWFGLQQYANTPARMNTKELFELRREAHINGYLLTTPDPSLVGQYTEEFIDDPKSTRVFALYEKEAYLNNSNYNWLDEISQQGVQQDHLVSFTGGSENNSYYLSFGYADQKGLVKTTGLTKYTGRINAEQRIKSWLKVGTNTSYTRSFDTRVDDATVQRAWNANPMLPIETVPTGLRDYPLNEGKIGRELYTLNYRGAYDQNAFNPISSLLIEDERYRNRILTSNYINWNPVEGLNVRTSFMVDYLLEARYKYTPKTIQESIRYSQDGQAEHTYDNRTVWQWDNTISYDRSFGNHKLNLLVGTSATSNNRNYTYATGKGFADDMLSYWRLNNSYKKDERDIGSEFVESSLLSYVARANYSYAGKYLLTATMRYDGSSKFAPDKRWGTFPSVSAAWNILEEDWAQQLRQSTPFSSAKLRAGFGMVGNQEIGDYAYYTLYGSSVTQSSGKYEVSYQAQGRMGNLDVTWEKQQQYNLGLDLSFLNSRIQFSADAFYIKNKDLLMSHSLPATTGFSTIIENVGSITNKGLELSVNAGIVRTSDWEWNVAASFSLDRNEITELYGNKDVVYNFNADRGLEKTGNLFLGEARNTLYIMQTGGIAQAIDFTTDANGNTYFQGYPLNFQTADGTWVERWNGNKVSPGDLYPLDANGDGIITNDADGDRVIVGSTDPKFYGGFSTDLSWKGIAVNAVFTYSYGAKKLSPYYEGLIGSTGTGAASADLVGNTWTPDNTGAEFPQPVADFTYPHYTASSMDFSVQDASFLRLAALTLSYTFPKSLIAKAKMSNLRLYATGSNLFCLTPYKGYDPEMGDWYPPTRMFVFGINLSF